MYARRAYIFGLGEFLKMRYNNNSITKRGVVWESLI